jgi:hypothetical protein
METCWGHLPSSRSLSSTSRTVLAFRSRIASYTSAFPAPTVGPFPQRVPCLTSRLRRVVVSRVLPRGASASMLRLVRWMLTCSLRSPKSYEGARCRVSDDRTLSMVLSALVCFELCASLHLGKSLTSTVTGYSMHNDQVSSVGKIIVLHHTVALFELGNMATKLTHLCDQNLKFLRTQHTTTHTTHNTGSTNTGIIIFFLNI